MNCLVCKRTYTIEKHPIIVGICNTADCYYTYDRIRCSLDNKQFNNSSRIGELEEHKRVMTDYLFIKTAQKDWHGVQDAASDLRDIEAEVQGLKL